jgi:hypothetical protein
VIGGNAKTLAALHVGIKATGVLATSGSLRWAGPGPADLRMGLLTQGRDDVLVNVDGVGADGLVGSSSSLPVVGASAVATGPPAVTTPTGGSSPGRARPLRPRRPRSPLSWRSLSMSLSAIRSAPFSPKARAMSDRSASPDSRMKASRVARSGRPWGGRGPDRAGPCGRLGGRGLAMTPA